MFTYMFYKEKNLISWVLLDIPSVHIILISIESTIWQLLQKLEDYVTSWQLTAEPKNICSQVEKYLPVRSKVLMCSFCGD